MKQKTVIITGASGNLGSAVAGYFLNENFHVIGLDHKLPKRPSQQELSFMKST
jgi:nucleoside-diphosphate-sugar epimerase